MKIVIFTAQAEIEGKTYGNGQVVAFNDNVDLSDLPCEIDETASIFVEHIASIE